MQVDEGTLIGKNTFQTEIDGNLGLHVMRRAKTANISTISCFFLCQAKRLLNKANFSREMSDIKFWQAFSLVMTALW